MNDLHPTPPTWILRLLRWFCPAQLEEGIIGDLLEQYEINLERRSARWSNWLFVYNGLRFLRISILRRKKMNYQSNTTAMLQNYFRISFRSLLKNKFFFSLNVLGLSIGIAACLLCYLHIRYELSYDVYNSNSAQIHRIITGDVKNGQGWVRVSAPMPELIQNRVPEIERYARLTNVTYDPKVTVKYGERIFSEARFFLADPDFLLMYDFEMVSGNKNSALNDMNSVILSESMAQKYFNEEDPIGKTLRVDSRLNFVVNGVFKDVPHNTHFDLDFLVSFENLERAKPGTSLTAGWGQFNYFAYLQLTPGASPTEVQAKIQQVEVNLGDNNKMELTDIGIQPLADIHFEDNRGNLKASYDLNYIYIYSAIAVSILFISFINFVNLSIASSTKRIKEVGIRKVVGARKTQLIGQFATESLLVTLFALAVAMGISQYLFIPAVNDLLETELTLQLNDPLLVSGLFGLLLLIALSSGSYIAYFVISYQPIAALKGQKAGTNKGRTFKSILLGIQFLISTVLIASSLFIYQQLGFLKDKDLGLDKEQVVNLALSNKEAQDKGVLLKEQIAQLPGVESVAASSFIPGGANWNQTVWWDGQEEPVSMFLISVDEDFIKTVDLELVEGDLDFIENTGTDQRFKYVLNESARELIGWESAVGKSFGAFGSKSATPIAGVVKDYNFRSLHFNVAPCVLTIIKGRAQNQLAIKINGDLRQTMTAIESTFLDILPAMEFEYTFMDAQFDELYKGEARTGKIVGALTVVAIVLAVLGLYALLTYAIQERTKELAIRKVLGIQMKSTLLLLSNNYLKIMIVTNLLAIPITIMMLNKWLANFSYRIQLGPVTFAVIVALSIAFILMIAAMKTMQTNRINPTQALRND